MSIEVLPLGTRCELACRHCYQDNIRDAGNQTSGEYDMAAMKKALEREGHAFTVFGGEPLLVPADDLEELWRFGFERYGRNTVQTGATSVTDRHFELFERYNVHVGISLEGPGELNDIRWAGSLERTRDATRRAEAVLGQLLYLKRPVSIITTLNRANARADRLPLLLEWFRQLNRRGLRHCNLHLMEIESEKVRRDWALTEDENATALLACADLQSELELRFQPITDMTRLLLGEDETTGGVSCIWNACDAGTTRAVQGINGQGEKINCSRTNKAGVDMQKADRELFVRPLGLFQVEQKHGGCGGCRFWLMCKGQCPGEAESGDWRRKTEHCGVLIKVFGELEKRLASIGLRPVSSDPTRRAAAERRMIAAFERGEAISVTRAINGERNGGQQAHGDIPHGDAPHGDDPHGDSHGDHTDES